MSKKTGDKYENELADILYNRGFGIVRTAGSGSSKKGKELPDLYADNGDLKLIFEVKSTTPSRLFEGYYYVEGHQIHNLLEFCRRTKYTATPYIAVRILTKKKIDTIDKWKFVRVDENTLDGKKNSRINREVIDNAESLEDVLGENQE